MELTVTGCIDCPLVQCSDLNWACCHPKLALSNIDYKDKILKENDNINPITPDWCPLKEEELTIKLV